MSLEFQDSQLMRCGKCGIEFYVPTFWYEARAHNGEGNREFYCPNGHGRVFRQTELDRVRQERDRLKQQLAQRDDALKHKEAQLVASRGQLTKFRKRAAAGTCPCCNRTFQNMARHMATKHPDFRTAEVVPLKSSA